MKHLIAIAALTSVCGLSAQAQEVYLKAGLPGVGGGAAFPLSDHFGVRADYLTLGNHRDSTVEEGIAYDGSLKLNRAAVLLDMYPFAGSFRVTVGATASKYRLDLSATGAGGSLTIGDTTYTTTADDRFEVSIRMPSSMPYIGIGWGHQTGSGLRFSFDIGAAIGKAKVTSALKGPWADDVSQDDIDAELAELRDGVGKIRAIPQITFGVGYSF